MLNINMVNKRPLHVSMNFIYQKWGEKKKLYEKNCVIENGKKGNSKG